MISKKHLLSLDVRQRDAEIRENLGLTYADLTYFREPDKMMERIYRAAEWLADNGYRNQITQYLLAALTYVTYGENRFEDYNREVGTIISKNFKDERKETEEKFGLDITNIQLLREEVGAYDGNLYEARHVWPNFQPSKDDWLRSVKIPTRIGFEEARLLGIDWGDGHIKNDLEDNHYIFPLKGNQDDFELYGIVGKEINRIHHVKDLIRENKGDKKFPWGGNRYSWNNPALDISSKAVVTWLMDDLGFPCPKENVGLPRIDFTEEQKTGFFVGIVAAMGELKKNNELGLTDKDSIFIQNLEDLSKDLGFTPRWDCRPRMHEDIYYISYQLMFSPREVRRMYERNWLFNPKHLK